MGENHNNMTTTIATGVIAMYSENPNLETVKAYNVCTHEQNTALYGN